MGDNSEAQHWELPCCFIFDFSVVKDIKRVYPFDSGAFQDGLYPSYIKHMPIGHFEAGAATNAPSKIIGAFFGDSKSYFKLRAKSDEAFNADFSPKVFDAELMALHRLSQEKSAARFDDRRFTIEVQSTTDLDLKINSPLAVIAPSPYFEDTAFLSHVENVWKSVPMPYPMFTLSDCSGGSKRYH